MSYSRRKTPDHVQRLQHWREWREENAVLIKASGVPESVFQDEAHWEDFLTVGDLYPVDFSHQQMTLPQKVALLRLISMRPRNCSTPVAGCMIDAVLTALEPRV